MSVIVVYRPRELWINHFGKFTILVNGKIVGKVKRGETRTFSGVSPGPVRVRAVIDWLGSRTIILNLSDHDVAHLEVTNGSLLALLDEREHYLDLSPLRTTVVAISGEGPRSWQRPSRPRR